MNPLFFERILEVVLPNGGLVVALYEAYFDESYTDTGVPVMAVGGYCLASEQAKKMDAEWLEILKRYGVPYFHMVEVAPCQGIFKAIGEEKCDALARDMIALIKRYPVMGLVALTNPNKTPPPDKSHLYAREPYSLCLQQSVIGACVQAHQADSEAKVAFFFESGHGTRKEANRLLNWLLNSFDSPTARIHQTHTFGERTEIRLLQAADILVWQAAKYVKDKINRSRPPRKDFVSLMEARHTFMFLCWEQEGLYHGSVYHPQIENTVRDGKLFEIFT